MRRWECWGKTRLFSCFRNIDVTFSAKKREASDKLAFISSRYSAGWQPTKCCTGESFVRTLLGVKNLTGHKKTHFLPRTAAVPLFCWASGKIRTSELWNDTKLSPFDPCDKRHNWTFLSFEFLLRLLTRIEVTTSEYGGYSNSRSVQQPTAPVFAAVGAGRIGAGHRPAFTATDEFPRVMVVLHHQLILEDVSINMYSFSHANFSHQSGAYQLLHSNNQLPVEHSARMEEIRNNEYPHYKGYVDPNLQSPSFKRLQYSAGVPDRESKHAIENDQSVFCGKTFKPNTFCCTQCVKL